MAVHAKGLDTNRFYVYVHKKADDGTIFYVGAGSGVRAYTNNGRSDFWKRTVAKYGLVVELIETDITWWEACGLEMTIIECIGRRNKGTGPLANITAGGEGLFDMPRTQEHCTNISKGLMGKKLSKEHREKITKIHRKRMCKRVLNIFHEVTYDSVSEAAVELGISRATITRQLSGKWPLTHPIRFLDTNENI